MFTLTKRLCPFTVTLLVVMLSFVSMVSAQRPVNITILHTNDIPGNLAVDYRGRGGIANITGYVDEVKAEVGAENVILLDAGDTVEKKSSSNAFDGEATVDIYNLMGYKAVAIGNREFDWGQDMLANWVAQSDFPWLAANIVLAGTDDHPDWVTPWTVVEVAGVKLGIIGLGTTETPNIARHGLTDGLEFQDPVTAVLRYYDEVRAQSNVLILLAHTGWEDRGEHKGGETIATELAAAGKPVNLIIGGHSHEAAKEPHMAGDTPYLIAYQYGRWVGRADITVDPATQTLTLVSWEGHVINDGEVTPNAEIAAKLTEHETKSATPTSKVEAPAELATPTSKVETPAELPTTGDKSTQGLTVGSIVVLGLTLAALIIYAQRRRQRQV
jgi:5'-nucleotidase/UDP-sugar diphosphatase